MIQVAQSQAKAKTVQFNKDKSRDNLSKAKTNNIKTYSNKRACINEDPANKVNPKLRGAANPQILSSTLSILQNLVYKTIRKLETVTHQLPTPYTVKTQPLTLVLITTIAGEDVLDVICKTISTKASLTIKDLLQLSLEYKTALQAYIKQIRRSVQVVEHYRSTVLTKEGTPTPAKENPSLLQLWTNLNYINNSSLSNQTETVTVLAIFGIIANRQQGVA